jgi:hypothetical protein
MLVVAVYASSLRYCDDVSRVIQVKRLSSSDGSDDQDVENEESLGSLRSSSDGIASNGPLAENKSPQFSKNNNSFSSATNTNENNFSLGNSTDSIYYSTSSTSSI